MDELARAIQRVHQKELLRDIGHVAGRDLFFGDDRDARRLQSEVTQDDLLGEVIRRGDGRFIRLGVDRKGALINAVRSAACLEGSRNHGFQ